jgi:hypothetical protein
MVRFARVVALDVAHHITQRGNARRFILETERAVYLDFAPTGFFRTASIRVSGCTGVRSTM